MKQLIAAATLATLGALSPFSVLQAQEAASFKHWTGKHSVSQHHRPNKPIRPARPISNLKPYTRPVSLHQAGERLERLEKRQFRLERALHRAQRQHASRSQIRALKQKLRRVDQRVQMAKRDYRHLLKRKLGHRQYRTMLNHVSWLSDRP
ncbi:MAG: hypothetical protein ACPGSC_01495 [Granulosicoccaceae bacterium]